MVFHKIFVLLASFWYLTIDMMLYVARLCWSLVTSVLNAVLQELFLPGYICFGELAILAQNISNIF